MPTASEKSPNNNSNASKLSSLSFTCEGCGRQRRCLAHDLTTEELSGFNRLIRRSRRLTRGDHLFRIGDPFNAIYTVRGGSLKTYTLGDDGREQILGFYLPGDILALDATSLNYHPSAAQTLEMTTVCEIPFAGLLQLAAKLPTLYQELLRQMSQQIRIEEQHTLLLGNKIAEQRLANLLVNLSDRFSQRGFSAHEFHLNMSRRDIGNYIGTAMETVSRLFSRLQSLRLIGVEGKLVHILDLEGLSRYACNATETPLRNAANGDAGAPSKAVVSLMSAQNASKKRSGVARRGH